MSSGIACGAVVGDAFDVKPADDASSVQGSETGAEGAAHPGNEASDDTDASAEGGVAPSGPITYVQGAFDDKVATPVTTLSASFPTSVKAGDTIIVALQTGASVIGISDGQNEYRRVVVEGPTTAMLIVYYALNVADKRLTVNVEFDSTTGALMAIHDYSGITTPEKTASQNGTGTAVETGAVSLTEGNQLLFAFGRCNVGLRDEASKDFTKRLSVAGNLSEDRVVSGEGTYAATFTAADPAGGAWTAVLASFKGAEKPSP